MCSSFGSSICRDSLSNTTASGYFCMQSICYKCSPGYYGTDGISCQKCEFGTWSVSGAATCGFSSIYSTPGFFEAYIPYGVTKINVRLWGGGGAGDACNGAPDYLPSAGGGGGFSSCNITVQMDTNVYVIVAGGAIANPDNYISNTGGQSPTEAASCQKPCQSVVSKTIAHVLVFGQMLLHEVILA